MPSELDGDVPPPSPDRLDDPQHWRDCADSARFMAEKMHDPDAVKTMRGVVEDYERLAEAAEERRRDREQECSP